MVHVSFGEPVNLTDEEYYTHSQRFVNAFFVSSRFSYFSYRIDFLLRKREPFRGTEEAGKINITSQVP
jgi:hypothetical protein